MTKEEFLNLLEEKFVPSGKWYNIESPKMEVKIGRRKMTMWRNYRFKPLGWRVFFCFSTYFEGGGGPLCHKGWFEYGFLEDMKDLHDIISAFSADK